MYKGWDIHSYTPMLQKRQDNFAQTVSGVQFGALLRELRGHYGSLVAFSNMQNQYKNGWIRDPHLPLINSAFLLEVLWNKIKLINDVTVYKHFRETLIQIGATCIQGISHRLLVDWISLSTPSVKEDRLKDLQKSQEMSNALSGSS